MAILIVSMGCGVNARAAAVSWTGAGDGTSWSDTNNWSGHALPGVSDDVTIGSVSGSPVIEVLAAAGAIHINSLALSEPLEVAGGSLQVTTTIQTSQTLTLSSGTIKSATISTTDGGSLSFTNGILDGTTVASDLTVSGGVGIKNGLTLNAVLTLSQGTIVFYGSQFLGGTGKVLFSSGGLHVQGDGSGTQSGSATLTIAPTMTLEGGGYSSVNFDYPYDSLLNQGTITTTGFGEYLIFNAYDPHSIITNQGTITAVHGGSMTLTNLVDAKGLTVTGGGGLDLEGVWTNTGTLTAYNSTLTLNGTWTNTGTITGTSSDIELGGTHSTADLGIIVSHGGNVGLGGTLNNTGSTLSVSTGQWSLNGVITGGAVTQNGSATVQLNSGTLDGVTLNGTFAGYGAMKILHGLTLNGNVTYTNGGDFYFVGGTQTLGGTGRITLKDNCNLQVQGDGTSGGGATLILGPNIYVRDSGYNQIYLTTPYDTVINQGTISIDGGKTFSINGPLGAGTFSNQGTVTTVGQASLSIQTAFSNDGSGVLNTSTDSFVYLRSSLLGSSTSIATSSPQGAISFQGSGTLSAPQLLEALSSDKGNVAAGFTQNAVFGSFNITNNTYVKLVDQAHNAGGTSANAFSAEDITVQSSCTLDLNGLHAYARSIHNYGTVINGTIQQLPNAGVISLNTPSMGNLATETTVDEWTFSGQAGQTISVLLNSGASPVPSPELEFAQLQLLDAANHVLATATDANAGDLLTLENITLPNAGTYKIHVSQAAGHPQYIGYYQLGVYNVASTALAFDATQLQSGSITTPFTTNQWTFNATAGQQVQFHIVPPVVGIEFKLIGPNGYVGFTDITSDPPLVNLPTAGSYTVVAYGPKGETGNYSFQLFAITPTLYSLNLDQPSSGKIAQPYAIDQWNFSAAANAQVSLHVIGAASDVAFELVGPNGYVAFKDIVSDSQLVNLPTSGNYTLVVYGLNGATGNYSFQLNQTDVTPLTTNTPYQGTWAGSGQPLLFSVPVTSNGFLSAVLTDLNLADHTEIYVRYGAQPTREIYDFAENGSGSNHSVVVPRAQVGTYYILVYGESIPATPAGFTIEAISGEEVLAKTSTSEGSASSNMTLTLTGAGFKTGAIVSLLAADGTTSYVAASSTIDLPTQITAGFTAGTVPAGTYSIVVRLPDGTTTTLPSAYTVVANGQGVLTCSVDVSDPIGRHIPSVIYVNYANTGTAPMPAPVLVLSGTNPEGQTGAFLTLNGGLVNAGFQSGTYPPYGYQSSVQILASGAIPGVLAPGESVRVPVYYAGWNPATWDFVHPSLDFSLTELHADDDTVTDWTSLETTLKPPNLSTTVWHLLYARLVGQLGTTTGSYVQFLDKQAQYLGRIGQATNDADALWSFAIAQAANAWPLPVIGTTIDASLPSAGALPLEFDRAFLNTIPGRFQSGILGLGWFTPWGLSLSFPADRSVTLNTGSGNHFTYQPDVRAAYTGNYFSTPGDHNKLFFDGNLYTLTSPSGKLTVFNPDGTLAYVQDANDNRITATYANGHLSTLTASSGQSLTLSYNAAGVLTRVADSAGRNTTYSYDASSRLVSVSRFDGTVTTYTYDTTSSSPSLNALTSIAFPGGSHQNFTYDTAGLLNGLSVDGGAQSFTLNYSLGQVNIINATGNTSVGYYDQNGQVAEVVDPLGNATYLDHDANYNLTQITNAIGAQANYTYNDLGQTTSVTDFLGNKSIFAYGGPNHRITKATDAIGNVTQFFYDGHGNLLTLERPDGSSQAYSYNSRGDVISLLQPSGDTLQSAYNSLGYLTRTTFPDQSTYTYSYDAKGRISSAQDATGTTVFAYGSTTGLLSSVTYPGGKSLTFTYDTGGRRTKMVDQTGFTVNYVYNSAGELTGLKDGGGVSIVTYTYDANGRLTKKTNSNGTSTTYQYDAAGNVLHQTNFNASNVANSKFDATYTALGQKATEATSAGTWTYSYDDDGELIHAVFASANTASVPNQDLSYAYDAAGNRTSTTFNGVTTTYAPATSNQYSSVGSATLSYDANGNLVSDGTNTFTYDALNRLTGDGTTTYTYNALGQRVAATANGQTIKYQFDPVGLGALVSTYNNSGAVTDHYTYGLGLTSANNGTASSFYDFDLVGSTAGVSNTSGAYTSHYSYKPFGETLTSSGSDAFQFGGILGGQADTTGLSFFRARSYDSALGRFLQNDPSGLGGGDLNLYNYCGGDPLNNVDPSGLFTLQFGINGNVQLGPVNANFNVGLALGPGKAAFYSAPGVGVGIGHHASLGLNFAATSAKTLDDLAGGFSERGGGIAAGGAISGTFIQGSNSDGSPIAGIGLGLGVGAGAEGSYTYTYTTLYPIGYVPQTKYFKHHRTSRTVAAMDPNSLYGPNGAGAANYVTDMGDFFSYRVTYENSATATAPAQTVTITNNLDPNLDWSTFQITGVGFGDNVIIAPAGSQHFQKTISMTVDGVTFDVQMEAGIHTSTGQVYAVFQSIDPSTGLPTSDVLAGFLPPEDGTGRGMGYITYTVSPKPNLAAGTQIPNVANIIFDGNAPLATDLVNDEDPSLGTDPTKDAIVSIDTAAPVSAMTALPASSPTSIGLSWNGTDLNGPGIATYTVYSSSDGGATYAPLLTDTALTSTTFQGAANTTYKFYVVATDQLGLVQGGNPQAAAVSTTTVATSTLNFAQWEAQSGHFNSTQLAQPTVSGAAATPQGDGVPNLLKYFLNINPAVTMTANDRAALPVFTRAANGDLTLTFREYAHSTLAMNVQISTDLATWTTVPMVSTPSVGSYTIQTTGVVDATTGDPYMQIDYQPGAGTHPALFLRLSLPTP